MGNTQSRKETRPDKLINILTEIRNAKDHYDKAYEQYKAAVQEDNPSMPDINDDQPIEAKNWYNAAVVYRTTLLKLFDLYDS